MLLPRRPLSLWSLQGAVIANELGQYCLEVSLALTQEEGNQMLSELVGRDRAESPEVFWDGSTDIGAEYNDNWRCSFLSGSRRNQYMCFLFSLMV